MTRERERMTSPGVRERCTGLHLYALFVVPLTDDRGHRAPCQRMCFMCMFHMLHCGYCICFIWMLLQWLYTYVASVFYKSFSCFIWMLHVFHLDVAYVAVAIHVCCKSMFQIFHLLYTYVASLCFKYFTCFKRMLQVFYLDVAYVAVIIHIVATYVLIVSPCFSMLQQVLLPTCSDLRASTRFTRRPCMTRRGPSR
jgi:hypothetical protein